MESKNYIYSTKTKQQMKNKVFYTLMICFGTFASAFAQSITNFSFENWAIDTNYLDLTLTNPHLLDTSISTNPTNWTTSNEISNGTVFHHKVLVTQSATSYIGASAIQLRSDSLWATINNVPVVNTVNVNFVCPGFAVCGNFPINLSAFVNLGSSFNPALLPGAGIPVAGRKASVGGYMKFAPVGGDTAYVIAILRKGATVVAQATYTRTSTDAAYSYFEAPFVYLNCLEPDTMVYTISSGNPYSISGVVLGTPSGLHIGTTLLADSIFMKDTIPGFGVVFPLNDTAQTLENTAVSILVSTNDLTCTGGAATLAQSIAPHHGTITVSGDTIIYTPAGNYVGMDTFTYSTSIGGGPSGTAQVVVRVTGYPAGINDIATAEGKISIYPNPANSKLHVSNNSSATELRIYDMLGKVMKAENLSTDATIDVTGFSNGLYIIQFSGNDGKLISSSRFTVIK